MKRICFITGTRADYGIMAPIMHELRRNPDVSLQVVATNMHLAPQFGETVREIEADGFKVDVKIPSLEEGDTSADMVLSMANVLTGLATAFRNLKPDLVVILGDRYEALAAAESAVAFNIPIAHLHGGETSEGAIDDKFRHAITQLSDFHFAATPLYVEKIISMGKQPEKVFHSGAPGAEVKEDSEDGSKLEALWRDFNAKTGLMPGEPFILLAFHPVTTLKDRGIQELNATLQSLDTFINQGYRILVTMPNSDAGNEAVSATIEEWASRNPGKVISIKSLGSRLFHFALENASAMVGNSSAALIEAPSHRLGAVNVGIRQKGRAHGITVLNATANPDDISKKLGMAVSLEMKSVLLGMPVSSLNPYFKDNASKFIATKLIELI